MTANENAQNESTMNQQRQPFAKLRRPASGFLGKLVAFVLSTGLLILAFIFSLAALAVVAVVGASLAGWLWWKTRAIRQQLRTMPRAEYDGGQIIEGEVVRDADQPTTAGRLLP
jgi:predicted lipid-binding transport protein (Tim44 family)